MPSILSRAGILTCGLLLLTPAANAAPTGTAIEPASQPNSTPALSQGPIEWSDFDQVTLAKGVDEVGEPQGLTVLPNGDVLHTGRAGTVFSTTYEGTTQIAAEIPVYNHDNDGLFAIAADPGFADNHWVYTYYAPPLDTPKGNAPEEGAGPADFEKWQAYNQLSRFKFADGKLDLSTEQVILRVDASRGMCCHTGGDINFGPDGNLFLSTGDDSNPFQSSGYAPIDERKTRNPAFDAQRGASNTNDLRGKLIRINVQANGSYTIPEGNMFPEARDSGDKTRPEIYAMGFRNPYRFSVDSETGVVYLGEYGPDAGSADPERGPGGKVEFNRITEPGFFGWPYCVGENTPYRDYNFATGESGPKFDCAGGPANESFRNDGKAQLPPGQPAWITYDGCSLPEFGCGSESPMGGPVYHFDAGLESDTKLPEYFDDKFFAYEYGRGWIKTITIGDNGGPGKIEPFFPTMDLTKPFDMQFGPKGSLYVLDYGSGNYGGAEDSALYRIDYTQGEHTPTAVAAADPTSGQAPLKVTFTAEGSKDADEGDTLTYAWDFDGDGTTDSTKPDPTHVYRTNGEYRPTLTVTDSTGKKSSAGETVVVGNTAPTVTFETPKNGEVFSFGDEIPYKISVTDPDGTRVDCSGVRVQYILGHATGSGSHGHPLTETSGCEGTIQTSNDGGHGSGADIYGVLHADYTDTSPVEGAPNLTGEAEIALQPRHKQAEFFADSSGVKVVDADGAQGGARVGNIDAGDWISFSPYNLTGVASVIWRVSSDGPGGKIELRAGSPDGKLVAKAKVPDTGGSGTYAELDPAKVKNRGGSGPLFAVFRSSGDSADFDVDSLTFEDAPSG